MDNWFYFSWIFIFLLQFGTPYYTVYMYVFEWKIDRDSEKGFKSIKEKERYREWKITKGRYRDRSGGREIEIGDRKMKKSYNYKEKKVEWII